MCTIVFVFKAKQKEEEAVYFPHPSSFPYCDAFFKNVTKKISPAHSTSEFLVNDEGEIINQEDESDKSNFNWEVTDP